MNTRDAAHNVGEFLRWALLVGSIVVVGYGWAAALVAIEWC